ncbi:MAG: hypothetical protein HQ518_06965 [Rhodopirellula sp.]|nr:hypothetical protein [Rhodopirellula sp.]
MKKFIITLAIAAASLLAANQASADSYHDYLARHPGVASKPALRNSPHVRMLMRQEQQSVGTPFAASQNDGLIEYGSAFAAPLTSGFGLVPTVTTHCPASHHNSFTIKPGNRHHWLK